jgi:hypothetical protein
VRAQESLDLSCTVVGVSGGRSDTDDRKQPKQLIYVVRRTEDSAEGGIRTVIDGCTRLYVIAVPFIGLSIL